MPMPPYTDDVNPELASRYVYTEDGEFSKALKIPTYQWMPTSQAPLKAMFLGIHGLTLHGRRFRVLARSLAINGAGFVSLDMRGFGRCKFDDKHEWSTKDDDKTEVDNEKSYQDIVKLATMLKEKYPDVKLIPVGESLGCTFCVRLAAEHPELVKAIAISAPAVKLNKDMYRGRGQIRLGVKAIIKPGEHELDLRPFFADLCSNRPEVQKEMEDDPLIRKKIRLRSLLSVDKFVAKTADYGKKTAPDLGVLILQGSADGCVSPKHVTDLMNAMPSTDQTLDWRGNYGHLQLETCFMRAQTISAIANWLIAHNADQEAKIKGFENEIKQLGGTVTK